MARAAFIASLALLAPIHVAGADCGPLPDHARLRETLAENGRSVSGFGHPSCRGGKPADDIINKLAETDPPGPK